MVYLKYAWLMTVRFMRKVFNKLPIMLSYFFLTFSFVVCLIILVHNCFDELPVLSYIISEHELPITYELYGKVKVLDENGNIVNKNVKVFIGGYSTSLTGTEFFLEFSSSAANETFVVIIYEVDEDIREFTKNIAIKEGNHVITEEFIIYA